MTSLRTFSLSLLAILALMLPACGGGGGGGETGGVTPPGADLPAIVAITPEPGSTDVEPNTTIEFRFGTDLDTSATPTNAISMRDENGTAMPGATAYDAGRRALVFTPASDLQNDRRYEVTLVDGITDMDGNVRPNPFLYIFDVVALEPSAAQPHENEVEDSRLRGFAVNNTGAGASLMSVAFPNRTDIVIRPYTTAGGFGPAIDVDSFVGDVTTNSNASVAVGANGKGIAVWRVNGPNGPDVFAVTFDAVAGTVGATHTLDATTDSSDNPEVVMSGNGEGVVIWRQRPTGGDRKIRAATYDPVNGWGSTVGLEPAAGEVVSAKVGISRFGGQAMVAWALQNGSDFISRARPLVNGSWGSIRSLQNVTNGQSIPQKVLVKSDGESMVILAYANTPTPTYRGVRTIRYRPPGLTNAGWQTLAQPTQNAGENFKVDAALVNGLGVVLVNANDDPNGAVLEARYYTTANGWGNAITVTTLSPSDFANNWVRVASRGDRYTLIDWTYDNGSTTQRRAALLLNGNLQWRDRFVPVKPNSGRAVLDAQGNARYVTRVDGVSDALETTVLTAAGVNAPAERIDAGTHEFINNYRFDTSANGRGVILWDGRPGAAGTPYDVLHAIID